MVNYRFFSRKNGWVGGADVKYFHSHEIVDELNETSIFIDWNGKQILNSLDRITNQNLKNSLRVLCEKYPWWYYYPSNTRMTDLRIYT